MNRALYKYAINKGVLYLTGAHVIGYHKSEANSLSVTVENTYDKTKPLEFRAKSIVFALNAYLRNFFPDLDVYPMRGQCVLTKPIKDLKIKGIFCFEDGIYYFRDYYNRILIGGGKSLDYEGERTYRIEGN